MTDTPTGNILCAHADGSTRPHLLRPGESCPGPRVLKLMDDLVADLDRIEMEHGREARWAAVTGMLAALGA